MRQGSDVIQSTIVNELLDADLVLVDLTSSAAGDIRGSPCACTKQAVSGTDKNAPHTNVNRSRSIWSNDGTEQP